MDVQRFSVLRESSVWMYQHLVWVAESSHEFPFVSPKCFYTLLILSDKSKKKTLLFVSSLSICYHSQMPTEKLLIWY